MDASVSSHRAAVLLGRVPCRSEGDVMPFLHGVPESDYPMFLPWLDGRSPQKWTVDEKIRYILKSARYRAQHVGISHLAHVPNRVLVSMFGSSMRNRIGEHRPEYHAEGFDIVPDTYRDNGRLMHTWRMVDWSEVDETQARLAI